MTDGSPVSWERGRSAVDQSPMIFAIMYFVAGITFDMSVKWAIWIGPWGGLFLGGTFTVGFWSAKHADD